MNPHKGQNQTNSSHYEHSIFSNYDVKTIDPGTNFICFTIFFCTFCTLLIPIFIILRDRQTKRNNDDGASHPIGPGKVGVAAKRRDLDIQGSGTPSIHGRVISISNSSSQFQTDIDVEERISKGQNSILVSSSFISTSPDTTADFQLQETKELFAEDNSSKRSTQNDGSINPHVNTIAEVFERNLSFMENHRSASSLDSSKKKKTSPSRDDKPTSNGKNLGDEFPLEQSKKNQSEIVSCETNTSAKYEDRSGKKISAQDEHCANDHILKSNMDELHNCPVFISKEKLDENTEKDFSNIEIGLKKILGDESVENDEKEKSEVCCCKKSFRKRRIMGQRLSSLKVLLRYDKEFKEIMKLAVPFTVGQMLDSIFELIDITLIGHFMGAEALSACVIAETLLGLTDEFIGGIIDALGTIIPQSVGVGNNYLTGQYVQITIGLYIIFTIPFIGIWWYFMYDAILWFGFDEDLANLGWEYSNIALITMTVNGIGEAFETFLEVNGFQFYVLIFGIVGGIIEVGMFLLILYNIEDFGLVEAAYFELFFTVFSCITMILIPIMKGWINEYFNGIFCNIAFINKKAVKNILKTAAPLSIGTVLAYGEWELLTIFAAFMGPAEVAAWGILGTIWDTFEASTEAIGDSAEVRVGYHLGQGNIEMAKTAAHKSLLIGTCLGVFVTIILFAIGDNLVAWVTSDYLLQNMVRGTIPYIGLGNVTMTFGMLCWSILGSQGRYSLATFVSFLTSWGIVIPSAALLTYVWNFNLKGLVASVIFGYSVTATIITILILKSDWETASQSIIRANSLAGETFSQSCPDSRSSVSSKSSSSISSNDTLSYDIEMNSTDEDFFSCCSMMSDEGK